MQNLLGWDCILENFSLATLSLWLPYQFYNVCINYAASKAPRKKISAISLPQTQLHPGCYHLVSLAVIILVPLHTPGHSEMFFCPLSTTLVTQHHWSSHTTCFWAQTSSCEDRSKPWSWAELHRPRGNFSIPRGTVSRAKDTCPEPQRGAGWGAVGRWA